MAFTRAPAHLAPSHMHRWVAWVALAMALPLAASAPAGLSAQPALDGLAPQQVAANRRETVEGFNRSLPDTLPSGQVDITLKRTERSDEEPITETLSQCTHAGDVAAINARFMPLLAKLGGDPSCEVTDYVPGPMPRPASGQVSMGLACRLGEHAVAQFDVANAYAPGEATVSFFTTLSAEGAMVRRSLVFKVRRTGAC